MDRRHQMFIACAVFLGLIGCRKQSPPSDKTAPSNARIAPHMQEGVPSAVQFDLKPISVLPSSPGTQLFDCTFTSRGQTAQFQLEFKQGPASGDGFRMAAAEGRFISMPDSINTVLLEELRKALDAKHMPSNVQRESELAFRAVVLGQKQSRSPDGGYSNNPPGDWVLVELFLPRDGDDGEVFLNFNPVLGKAEFSIKDSDYGDYVLGELAKVL